MLPDKLPLLSFSSPSAFKRWLAAQPRNSQGAWLKFAKKGAAEATISKSDAIDLALAHGWIDGQLGRVDEFYFKTRFTPRKPKGAWSKINCERAERLIVSGQMTQQGLAQVDAAKADGRWEAAYPSQSTAAPHADLEAALDDDPRVRKVFDALDSANRYAINHSLLSATIVAPGHNRVVSLPPEHIDRAQNIIRVEQSKGKEGDDARCKRVHSPLPDPCLAIRLPPHPLLWLPHLSNPRQEYRAYP